MTSQDPAPVAEVPRSDRPVSEDFVLAAFAQAYGANMARDCWAPFTTPKRETKHPAA